MPRTPPVQAPGAPGPRRSPWRLWRRCWEGREPAESLTPQDREDLIGHLHRAGWSDEDMARHTRLSMYTTARIRDRIGLAPNQQNGEVIRDGVVQSG